MYIIRLHSLATWTTTYCDKDIGMHHTDRLKPPDFESIINRNSVALDTRFQQEITRLFYKQAPFVSISLFFMLAVIYPFFTGAIPGAVLTTWLSINLLCSILLLLTYFAHLRHAARFSHTTWLNAYILLQVLQDVALGMLGPMSALLSDETSRFLILFLLAGSAAGAIATRGILFRVYFVAVSALLLPVALTHALMDYALANELLILTLVFYVFMLFVGKNYSNSIRNNIKLWLNLEVEIEARRKTEAQLREAKQLAEAATETKNHFLANVSHELRTPLNGIIGFSNALNKCGLTTEQSVYADHIIRSSRTLLSMVNDVLDVTTIEAGQLKLQLYPFELADEMEEVTTLAQTLAAEKGLTFEYRIATPLPQQLVGDSQRLKQIINNLITNAIKYTEQGYVRMQVSATPVAPQQALLQITIEDSGIGIPAEAHATLFDTFTRVTRHGQKQHDGVGLGLSIVSNLLQQMSGSIDVSSTEGKGSCFEVTVPLDMQSATTSWETSASHNASVAGPATNAELQQLRLLIVDDNEVNRLVLKTFIEPYRIPFHEAGSGNEALSLLAANDYDLVLLDINMPDLSGIEVREAYRQSNPAGPDFIAVTAHALHSEIEAILQSGFKECLIKPLAEGELIGLLRRFAQQHRPR